MLRSGWQRAGRGAGGEKNAPDSLKSGAWICHAVPPWFSCPFPGQPSKPPTRPRPVTGPDVPSYFARVRTNRSGTSYTQGGRTPVRTDHRLSEWAFHCLYSLHRVCLLKILAQESGFVKGKLLWDRREGGFLSKSSSLYGKREKISGGGRKSGFFVDLT